MIVMSERLMKLLAELEYLSTLGQSLIHEYDEALQRCNSLDVQDLPNEALSSSPTFEN